MTLLSRRGILRCLIGIIAAPAVVKADNLMRIVAPRQTTWWLLDPDCDYEKFTNYFIQDTETGMLTPVVAPVSIVQNLILESSVDLMKVLRANSLWTATTDQSAQSAIATRKLSLT